MFQLVRSLFAQLPAAADVQTMKAMKSIKKKAMILKAMLAMKVMEPIK